MNKIVVDTNILLSALFSNKGASFLLLEHIVKRAEEGEFINCVSIATVLELEEVMFRSKHVDRLHYLDKFEKNAFIDDVVAVSNHIKLNYLWRPYLKDIKDDKILETAFNASADCIVTYNLKDFQTVESDFDIQVLTPKIYLKLKGLL